MVASALPLAKVERALFPALVLVAALVPAGQRNGASTRNRFQGPNGTGIGDLDRATLVALSKPAARIWTVYVLHSKSGARTYVGVTNDLPRRLQQHNGRLPGGARSTRPGRPWRVRVIYGPFATRGEAQRVEHEIKQRRGAERLVREG